MKLYSTNDIAKIKKCSRQNINIIWRANRSLLKKYVTLLGGRIYFNEAGKNMILKGSSALAKMRAEVKANANL